MKRIISIILLFILVTQVHAELVVNEVMYNEPEGLTSLEWIELYNNSDTAVQLDKYHLYINSSYFSLPAREVLAEEYIILVRKLFKGSGTTSFETYWGNDSGIWGDDPFELTMPDPIELPFSLPNNDTGIVQLIFNDSLYPSIFFWLDAGQDGVSLERVYPDSFYFEHSVSKQFSTPGYLNSVSFADADLSIEDVQVIFDGFNRSVEMTVKNRGYQPILYRGVNFQYSNITSFDGTLITDTLFTGDILKDTFVLSIHDEMYIPVKVILEMPDDRPENDSLWFTFVGSEFPPLVINEFLANPFHGTEWIEVYNRSDTFIDISDWSFGDAQSLYRISDTTLMLPPDYYLMLLKRPSKSVSEVFTDFNSNSGIIYYPFEPWPQLNNDEDSIRLIDRYGIPGDIVYYTSLQEQDYSMSREAPIPNINNWYRSEDIGGTPGFPNRIFKYNQNDEITIQLDSKYFVYYTDPLSFNVTYPEANSYSIKIYNKNGQLVAVVVDEFDIPIATFEWNGETVSGNRLPIGMYILVVEAEGVAKAKETFVVAR